MKKFLALISITILFSSCNNSDLCVPISYRLTSNDSTSTITTHKGVVKYKVGSIKPYKEILPLPLARSSYTKSQSTKFCVYELEKMHCLTEYNSFSDYITIVDCIGKFNIGDVIVFETTLAK